MVSLTVSLHLAGLDLLLAMTGLHFRLFKGGSVHLHRLFVPLGIVLGLFALHGLEIWLYAGAYHLLGLTPDLEHALFVSISSYSTLGESTAAVPPAWRVFHALEAINGMLLIGWSTAFLFQVLHHLLGPQEDERLPRGAISRPPRRRAR
jgi:hypothetical protein